MVGTCNDEGRCRGDGSCSCFDGFFGAHCDKALGYPCVKDRCDVNATCTNDATPDGYNCTCYDGYANIAAAGGPVVCDLDECATAPCDVPPLPKRDI
ncbi:hypothetical protein T484DRAFT_1791207 [Baffinella frigidus]|nr:hypothetical protein T484DRAFT_1791207 [Cryptophyta sp. CCMP2293]